MLNKILLAALGALLVFVAIFVIYKERQIAQMQTQMQQSVVSMQQLQDNIIRSQSQLVSKQDLTDFANQNQINLNAIETNLSSMQATLTGINAINVNSTGQDNNNVPSTNTTPNTTPVPVPTVTCNGQQIPCPNDDPFGYQANEQNLSLNEPFGATQVPIGQVGFVASQKAPWDLDIYPRKYTVVNVLGTATDGSHYVYNKFTINSNGKDYPVDITNAQYKEELPAPSFSWWNPRLFMGVSASVDASSVPLHGEISPELNVGLMSYGKTKTNPDISVLQAGVGYGAVSHTATLNLNPVNFNLGSFMNTTLVNNTYIGPSIQMNTHGDIFGGGVISVGF